MSDIDSNEFNFYPFNYVTKNNGFVLREGNKCVLKHRRANYCGYVVIENILIPAEWLGNYNHDHLELLNVHGGITYADQESEFYSVFGFDCAHAGDEENDRLKDINYILELTEVMEQQILERAKYIGEYRELKNMEDKINHLDKIRKTAVIKSKVSSIPMMLASIGFNPEE